MFSAVHNFAAMRVAVPVHGAPIALLPAGCRQAAVFRAVPRTAPEEAAADWFLGGSRCGLARHRSLP